MAAAVQPCLIDRLRPDLSDDRIAAYLRAAGHDHERALALHMWNARVGEAFHVPIQTVELAVRNHVAAAFAAAYGPGWWCAPAFLAAADADQRDDLTTARQRIARRGLPLVTGQVVAALSLGFWVGLLRPRHNPAVWSGQLRVAFPYLPADKSRHDLAKAAERVAHLRNRIWHHEPIIRRNLSEDFAVVMDLLGWISPDAATWIRPHCRVPELLRQKP